MLETLQLRSLETLRQSFQTASHEFGPLRCTLVESGPKTREKAPREAPPGLYSKEHVVAMGGDSVHAAGPFDPKKRVVRWHWITSGDKARGHAAIGRFSGLANDLDRVFPYGITALQLSIETLHAGKLRWLYTLFDLAWQRREGSPLAADKRLWVGDTTFLSNPAGPDNVVSKFLYKAAGRPLNEAPDSFCSTLPDVFAASGQAIDVVLHGLPATNTAPAPPDNWMTVSEAAKLLLDDVDKLDLKKAKARVSWAAGENKFRTNGKKGVARRIDRDSFSTWRLEQRERDLDALDE